MKHLAISHAAASLCRLGARCPASQMSEPAAVVSAVATIREPSQLASFEPHADPAQFLTLALVIAVPFCYWWLITVPEARLELSKGKRKGDTREFIEELREADGRVAEKWFFSKWIQQAPRSRKPAARVERGERVEIIGKENGREREEANDRSAPGGLTTLVDPVGLDSPNDSSLAERKTSSVDEQTPSSHRKEKHSASSSLAQLFTPATAKGNPTPKFFSGDNPIVVATGALMAMGVAASLARENSALATDAFILAAGIFFGLSRLDMK